MMSTRSNQIYNRLAKSKAGFTLVEMIVATVILAVGIVGAAAAFNSATRASAMASEIQIATMLAQQQLSQTETQAQGNLTGGDTEGDFGADYPGYHWKQSISATDYTNLFQVSVTVSWGKFPGHEKTVSTYLMNVQQQTSTSTGTTTGTASGQ
jgi:type II secretion system protein I